MCVAWACRCGVRRLSSQNTELFLVLIVFQPRAGESSSLLWERLLQNITDRVAYQQQKLLAFSSGGWKTQLRTSTGG